MRPKVAGRPYQMQVPEYSAVYKDERGLSGENNRDFRDNRGVQE